MRNTPTKRLVAELFRLNPRPLSLAEIYDHVRAARPQTAYSTVYRIVSQLESGGRVNRIDWRERGSRFEWAELPHHHHIVCSVCGEIRDFSDADLGFDEARLRSASGFAISHHSIELEGLCPRCQTTDTPSATAPH